MSTRSCSPGLSNRTAKSKPTRPSTAECHFFQFLIVDDHSLVRNGLRQILASTYSGAGIFEARDAKSALACATKNKLDVVLLDISMPGQSGLDVLKQIKELQPDAKILILTMHPEDQYAIRVLKSGASGYLTKDSASDEVAVALKKILAGGTYVSAALAENLASNLHAPAQKSPHDRLSDREYQILRMIGVGKSVKEIAYDLSLSIKTISTYRARVLTKLKFKGNADVIRYAMREKLVD